MRSLSFTAALFVTTCFLASCGGGSGTPGTQTSATCDSNTLWAVPLLQSGASITDNNAAGLSVTWDNQTCTLRSVSSVTLDICLNHSQPTDLVWTITAPSAASALTLTVPVNWNATGTACGDSGPSQGKLQRIDLPAAIQSIVTTRGLWTLNVSDRSPGNTGTLIQWRVIAQGYN